MKSVVSVAPLKYFSYKTVSFRMIAKDPILGIARLTSFERLLKKAFDKLLFLL